MRPRNLIAILVAVLVAAGCIRLGLWQLDRREQRRAINALAEARMHDAPARTLATLAADTGAARYRPVELTGTFDFGQEIVLSGRSHQGSPGVNLLTPLRVPGEERAVLVNRGWVYAPDGATVDAARWREAERTTVRGYAVPMTPVEGGVTVRARTVRHLDPDSVAALMPYPVMAVYVVDTSSAGTGSGTPARLGGITLEEGPHLGYAVQWFSFAAIAIIGVLVLVWRDRSPAKRDHGVDALMARRGG